MPLSEAQVRAIGLSDGRANLWEGSVRSGKTFSSILRFLTAVASASKYGQVVVIGKNTDSIYRNFFSPIETLPELEFIASQVKYKQGSTVATVLGRKVHVLGANDAKAEKRIRGMTVALAYVDEVTVLPEDFFKQLLARMSAPGAQLFGTTNPDSPSHWLKKGYLDRLDELSDWRVFKFRIDDNPSLTEAYKESLKREYTGLWYKRFILGLWVAAEGAIYDSWDEDLHVVDYEDLPQMVRVLGVGVDYGTTNATAAVALGLGSDGVLYAVDEWRFDAAKAQRRLTDPQLTKRLAEWVPGLPLPPEWYVVDPAAASFKVQLAAEGVSNLTNGDNNVGYGIRTVASLLASGKLKVSSRCKGLLEEVPGYVWDTKATEKGEDQPVKLNDHSLDALRYVVATTESVWRNYVRI